MLDKITKDQLGNILKNQEKAILSLRSLYRSYGYLPFKMSKFEEYDLYLRNKDFLISEGIITFNDTSGKLLALKPDVTLSIVKNATDQAGCKQKFCYDENVYRISGSTQQYKELMQAGLECIGDIDLYDILEVITLAARSLSLLSDGSILTLSHPGIITSLLDSIPCDAESRRSIISCFAEKNTHDLERLCAAAGIPEDMSATLSDLIGVYGDIDESMARIEEICGEKADGAVSELRALVSLLSESEYADTIRIDISLVSDSDYYNGFVFKGFVPEICDSVLMGGQYGKLLRRMGRRSDAVGFAIYLDRLEQLDRVGAEFDVDVLLLYSDSECAASVAKVAKEIIAGGRSVSAQKAIPAKLRYRELLDIRGGQNSSDR